MLWCCKFILESDVHPRARHIRWRSVTGLSGGDVGVSEHEAMMRALEFALCYDQLQAAELATMEVLVRRAQMVELKYRDRVVKLSPTGGVEDDEHLYMGTGLTRGLLMICPDLEDWVAGELQREASAAKERRKMREERGLVRPPPNAKAAGRGNKGGD